MPVRGCLREQNHALAQVYINQTGFDSMHVDVHTYAVPLKASMIEKECNYGSYSNTLGIAM